ncbi:MAG: ABC transporter substrate-binding protein [Clostridiaceae bacterium]|nr:ABC transporter substrate-binding protein [Clostridiaceae bacterium]
MKHLKKLLPLLLVFTLIFALTACSSGSSTGTTTASATTAAATTVATTTTTAATTGASDTLTTANPGVLTMATNAQFPPYEFYEGSTIVGIDAEIAGAVAEKLGLTLQIEDMEFDSIIEAVKTGKVDIGLAGMTVTPERAEEVNFTESYATGVQVIIVAEGSAITSVDDLFADGASHTIGVQRNTTGDLYTTWDLEEEGLATIDRYSKGADAVQALKTGKVDCVVIDNEPAKAFVAEVDGLKILDTEYVQENYAGAMSKDNEALYNAVNDALKELIADGTVQSIIDKYIKAE